MQEIYFLINKQIVGIWYGENKEFTDGKNGIWTYGIRYYSSSDLQH